MSEGGLETLSGTAWISQGFERLIHRVRQAPADIHFDVLIIGSGYGGAVAASTFAGRKQNGAAITVGVLERGTEYLPGAFPTGLGELPAHIRRDNNKEGLFDVRLGGDVTAVVANGVGGGSLINAGVMLTPAPSVFQTGWPSALGDVTIWSSYFDRARELLGAGTISAPNTILNHVDGLPQKFEAIRDISPQGTFTAAPITVAMTDSVSAGNVELRKCVRCGDCASGCNFGAKNSLDVNLLVRAQQAGAEIFSGATVLSIEKEASSSWIINCVHTNAVLRKRDGKKLRLRASKVILAAGTLGSSEILLRSRALGLPLSDALGTRCSTNGDMLIVDYATASPVHTVADETVKPSTRAVGPTITGVIDLRATAGVVIEEMSVPAALRVAFTEVFATVSTLHGLAEDDCSNHNIGFPTDDLYVAPNVRVEHSALYAVMGDDGAAGSIELNDDLTLPDRDGTARLRWDKVQNVPLFDVQVETVADVTKDTGGRVIPNPVWKLLPPELSWLLKDQRGPLTTVHPLGGCVMGDSGASGVVDQFGRVFSSNNTSAVHDGLVVLDGSIIPTALCANPALTISAVALRAAEELALLWNYEFGAATPPSTPLKRPVFRLTDKAAQPATTEVEIIERLVGPVTFAPSGGLSETYIAELTIRFSPKALAQMTPSNGATPILLVATDTLEPATSSRIRIYREAEWRQLEASWNPPVLKEQKLEALAILSAPLSGKLRLFERQSSNGIGRIFRSSWAWLLNRGLRDIYQAIVDGDGGPGLFTRIKSGLALASHAGEIRSLIYDLTIGTPEAGAQITLDGSSIMGTKTFTYERKGNPWRQLMEVTLDAFPGLNSAADRKILKLDPRYLAQIGVPLFRIINQRDGVSALAELVTFLGYTVRLLLGLHIWSFRAPDKDTDPGNDVLDLLPPAILSLPNGGLVAAETPPRIIPIGPAIPDGGTKPVLANVRITRYPKSGTTKRPVVMLHGYSAGGTTFAHHAVNPNFASHFWMSGRDVWIADMRTSSGHPTTAVEPWSFDQIGEFDVPAVIEAAAAESIDGTVDVIAHCMGTVVFSIAVLKGKLTGLVNRAAFTQVGPLVVFTPANVFRAYVMRYLVDFLPSHYEFNPKNPTLADDLWDRLLSTLPYPVEEFEAENPLWPAARTPWTRTRHRMDALYGRDFNVLNMESEMLRFIDEHFGALNLKTVSSTVNFARYSLMTDFRGFNKFVSRENFSTYWKFPTFSVHGSANGLSDVSTLSRMEQILGDAGCEYRSFINEGAGHQDALIGTTRYKTLSEIEAFLDAATLPNPIAPNQERVAYSPWIGPIITEERQVTPARVLRVGALPSLRAPEAALMLSVVAVGDQILRPDDPTQPWDLTYITDHLVVYVSTKLSTERWDAFEAPLPWLMPDYDPAHPGNALLVLLVYNESPALAAFARHYFRAKDKKVSRFNPVSRDIESPIELFNLDFEQFEKMVKAAEVALKPYDPKRRGIAPNRPIVYRGKDRIANNPRIDPVRFDVTQKTASLTFAYGPDGDAVLRSLIEQELDLSDGIVPYDPQPATPAPTGTSFTLASCQYPAGFIDEPVAYRSYAKIAERLLGNAGIKPRFCLFIGDQVYVDATAGLYDPTAKEDRNRLPYEAWLRQRSVRSVLRRVPSFMLLDDHEIDDNWEPVQSPDTAENIGLMNSAFKAFQKYQRGRIGGFETFEFDGYRFFMLDTRTERTHRSDGDLANATLFETDANDLSKSMGRLQTWLMDHNMSPAPKFILSPSMLLPRHRRAVQRDTSLDPSNLSTLHADGWEGYPNTLRDVLGFIAKERIERVVFLSGDEHRGCIANVDIFDAIGALAARVHSIHTAAMYAPFPFANGLDESLVLNESIQIASSYGNFRCVVNATRPAPGDGATFLAVKQVGASWELDYEYADGAVHTILL